MKHVNVIDRGDHIEVDFDSSLEVSHREELLKFMDKYGFRIQVRNYSHCYKVLITSIVSRFPGGIPQIDWPPVFMEAAIRVGLASVPDPADEGREYDFL